MNRLGWMIDQGYAIVNILRKNLKMFFEKKAWQKFPTSRLLVRHFDC